MALQKGQTVLLRRLAADRFSVGIAPSSGTGAAASTPAAAGAAAAAEVSTAPPPPPPSLPSVPAVAVAVAVAAQQTGAPAVGSKRHRQQSQESASPAVDEERPPPAVRHMATSRMHDVQTAGRQRLLPLEQQREQLQELPREQPQPQPQPQAQPQQPPEAPAAGAAAGLPGAGAGAGAGAAPPTDEVAIHSEAFSLVFQVGPCRCQEWGRKNKRLQQHAWKQGGFQRGLQVAKRRSQLAWAADEF